MRDSVPSARYSSVCNVLRFVMYCVNGASRSFPLIESTDSMMSTDSMIEHKQTKQSAYELKINTICWEFSMLKYFACSFSLLEAWMKFNLNHCVRYSLTVLPIRISNSENYKIYSSKNSLRKCCTVESRYPRSAGCVEIPVFP